MLITLDGEAEGKCCSALKGAHIHSWCSGSFHQGPQSVYEWDKEQAITDGFRHTLGSSNQHLPALLESDAEM